MGGFLAGYLSHRQFVRHIVETINAVAKNVASPKKIAVTANRERAEEITPATEVIIAPDEVRRSIFL